MNRHFEYRDSELHVESIALSKIASEFGTPTYIYSKAMIEENFHSYTNALGSFENLICYSVKANSNLAVLNILARLGAGFDIVSIGELQRVLNAGGDPQKIVFSGIGKTIEEMRAALNQNIYCFNIESKPELETLNKVADSMGKVAPVAIRINPDINASTHPYIATGMRENKFGVPLDESIDLYEVAQQLGNVRIEGIDCHIGSQLTEIDPIIESLKQVLDLVEKLKTRKINLKHINLGGGLGVVYRDETPPSISNYVNSILKELNHIDTKLILEPGRSIVANAGILVTKVLYLKTTQHKNFAIVDAAMNDLLRPSLYEAWLEILPTYRNSSKPIETWDVVGPICESGDFLGLQRDMALKENDTLAVLGTGAYGFSMSSNYNSRCRAAELIVDKDKVHLARRRESIEDLFLGETCMPNSYIG